MTNYIGVSNVPATIYTNRYPTDVRSNDKVGKVKESGFDALLRKHDMQIPAKNSDIQKQLLDKDGTDLALGELADQLAKQFLSTMFREVHASVYADSGISAGEMAFRQELDDARVRNSDLGHSIAAQIYNEVKRAEGVTQ